MKILFMGTPEFAVFSLKALIDGGKNVVAVVTQPDQPKGRGYVMTPPAVKVFAEERGIPVYQPQTLRNGAFDETLKQIDPDLIVVTAYGKILPKSVLDYPKHGCVNVHASLLPEYRGAAPMQRAIIEGKKQTGITTMMMDEGLDTGDILLQRAVPIGENDNFETVHDRMGEVGGGVLIETVNRIERGEIRRIPQDGSRATYAAKIEKSDCGIDFRKTAREVHDLVRGLSPVPLAFTHLPDGKLLKITETSVADGDFSNREPGSVIALEDGEILVACGKGAVAIRGVLPEGKARMTAEAFINGRKIAVGNVLGKN